MTSYQKPNTQTRKPQRNHLYKRNTEIDLPIVVDEMYSKGEKNRPIFIHTIISAGERRECIYFRNLKDVISPKIELKIVNETRAGIKGADYDKIIKEALDQKRDILASMCTDNISIIMENITNDDRLKEEFNKITNNSDVNIDTLSLTDFYTLDLEFLDKIVSNIEWQNSINIITDVDHFETDILKHQSTCSNHDIRVYISNPCFEIWLYYSTQTVKPKDFPKKINPGKISKEMKKYNARYNKGGGIDTRKVARDIDIVKYNIKNSRANYTLKENNIPALFSTNVHLLIENLI